MSKTILKSTLKPAKSEMINIKITRLERKLLQGKADKYTNGNVSAWMRYAAINLEPKVQDLVTI